MDAPAPQAVVLAIRAPLARADLPGLYARVCALLAARGPALVRCDVAGLPADAIAVDALARLGLAARRHGCRVRLLNAPADLLDLLAFMGLDEVVAERSPPD